MMKKRKDVEMETLLRALLFRVFKVRSICYRR